MHVRCAKLLSLRSEQTAKLSYEQFKRMYGMIGEFVAHTDNTVPRSTPGLKGDLVSLAKGWLDQYHKKKKNHLQVYYRLNYLPYPEFTVINADTYKH